MTNYADTEVTIGDGKTEVKTTLGNLSKVTEGKAPMDDIFAWANNLVSDREDYDIHLYFLSKNNVVYSVNAGKELDQRFRELFLDGAMEDVLEGVERGLVVRKYEDTVKGDKTTLAWIELDKVHRAQEAIRWIDEHSADIQTFKHDEHDIKRIKGVFAKFSKPDAKPFYIFKSFAGGSAVAAKKDFVMRNGKTTAFSDDTAFKIDASSQVVIIGQDVYAFSQGKFESLFDMKPHQVSVANRNGAILDERFKLTMPLIVKEIGILAQQSSTALKKLSDVDPYAMDQSQVEEAIEEYGIPLMLDDGGAIIIEDASDIVKLCDVLNDNYLHGINGNYLAKSKKPFEGEADADT